jgi:hypothetical protein
MFLTPLLGIIKYEGLHGIIYRVCSYEEYFKIATIFLLFIIYYLLFAILPFLTLAKNRISVV